MSPSTAAVVTREDRGRDADDAPSVLAGSPDDAELADQILQPLWRSSKLWYFLFALTGAGVFALVLATGYTFTSGIGVWGNNIPVAWAFAIVNFVWWIGLGHAGTFISAFLLLLEQKWRGSINRLAEAMTLFAIALAGLFPLLHLGRPWFFYWLVPYPATMRVWPQFRSTLPWDVAAIATYGTVSLLFWYLGLLPDLAAARDRAPTLRRARIYGIFALGWRGSARDWHRFRIGYGLLAGLAAPLVISVHSIVSMDFAIANLPGWHSTLFPPYFVVGAIYSGFALVVLLMLPLRWYFDWQNVITERHLDAIGKILLVTGSLMLYAYVCEGFLAWYSGEPYERFMFLLHRPLGWPGVYWSMIAFNVFVPMIYWSRRMRRNWLALFAGSALILVGMWIERFVIVVTALDRDFLPSSWLTYRPTWVDWTILLGSCATFLFMFLLFLKFVPAIAIHEVRRLKYEREGRA